MNAVGKIVVVWCVFLVCMLIAGLFSSRMLHIAFVLYIVTIIPTVIALFFVRFDKDKKR